MTRMLFILFFLPSLLTANTKGTEGFWRITEDKQKAWFLSPNNEKNFLCSVGNIRKEQPSKIPDGPHYKSNEEPWELITSERLRGFGFNCAGAWGEIHNMPYYEVLSIYQNLPQISDPNWEAWVEKFIKEKTILLKDDKNLVGYFLDNEIDWVGIDLWAEKYFQTTFRLLKKYDPNHLILGVRFNKPVTDRILRLAAIFDANSVNVYRDDGNLPEEFLLRINRVAKTPILISEFSFYSDENQSGNRNTKGFGGKVRDQETRAKMYVLLAKQAAAYTFIIGIEWFQWMDEPPDGRWDGEDCNYGLVDIFDRPYKLLIEATKKTNAELAQIH